MADILLAGKGLASGLPLSALIARDELHTWTAGSHGSTFGGNPVSCASARATLDLVRASLAANAATVGGHALSRLAPLVDRHTCVTDVRGRGLMIGIEFTDGTTAKAVEQAAFDRGLVVLACGPATLRLAPPLIITSEQIDIAVDLLSETIDAVAGEVDR